MASTGGAGRRKWVAWTVAVVLVAASGTGAVVFHERKQQAAQNAAHKDAVRAAVKMASIYATDIGELETKSSKITFGEYFKKTEAALSEIDKSAIQLKSAATGANPYLDPSLGYIKQVQDLIRTLNAGTRATMSASSVSDRVDRIAGGSFSVSFRLEQLQEAQRDLKKAIEDKEKADAEGLQQLKSLRPKAAWVQTTLGPDAGIAPNLFDELEKKLSGSKSKAS
ncbi:hypothetical protein [Ramlibacter sp. AN1133]|uniref:hypothetical protein n=1 Tax=Ramlibacter sp. AN1133 TaxID=3133429 RepID=UPI0030BEFDAE